LESSQETHADDLGAESALNALRANTSEISTQRNHALASALDYLAFRRLPGQLPVLDGLRGIAVLLVLLRHASYLGMDRSAPLVPIFGVDISAFMLNGWIGVDLFFVLSGFLISHHIIGLNERHDGDWPWKRYLAKRGLRIIPAYYAVLFLTVLGAFPGYAVSDQWLGIRIGYHLLFLQDYLPSNIVVAFWSMGVEEKFYLVAPFLVLACAKRPSIRARVGGPVAIVFMGVALRVLTLWQRPEIVEYQSFFLVFRSPFHLTLDPILIGVVLAILYRGRDELPRLTARNTARSVFWLGMLGFILLTTSGDMMAEISWWDKSLQPLAIAATFGAITFGLLFGGDLGGLFGSAFLLFFARISYCLYLVHLPLIPLAKAFAGQDSAAEPSFALFFAIFVALSVLAALLLHYLIEKPFLKLKDRIR
jgi:peptidoglycan/LPS O-acetylase OafA/YrhL